MAVLGGYENRGGSVLHGAARVGVASQQFRHDVQVTALRRHDERSPAVLQVWGGGFLLRMVWLEMVVYFIVKTVEILQYKILNVTE